MITNHDVLIIGGGPSGTGTAAILAEYGHKVLVLEREKFPRYHIGESLIPFTFGPLERLGLIPKMPKHFGIVSTKVCLQRRNSFLQRLNNFGSISK